MSQYVQFPTIQKILLIAFIWCLVGSQLSAQVCLGTKTLESDTADEILVAVTTENFTDIISLQFSLRFDPGIYKFIALESTTLPSFNAGNFSVNAGNVSGVVRTVWLDPAVTGITLPPENTIATFRFKKLTAAEADFTISNDPLMVEVVGPTFVPSNVFSCNTSTALTVFVEGKFLLDQNMDCSASMEELETSQSANWNGWKVRTTQNGKDYYSGGTIDNGNFLLQLFPGENEIEILPPNPYYSLCNSSFSLNTEEITLDNVIEVYTHISTFCPLMTVDIFSVPPTACDSSALFISYRNNGTAVADNAYIDLDIDEHTTILESSTPYSIINDRTIRFDLGAIEMGADNFIFITTLLSCEVSEGAAICNEAKIFPNDLCGDFSTNWSGASLKVDGQCVGEEIIFEIENIGKGDMVKPSEFIVIEDAVVFKMQPIQLNQGDKELVKVAANGATYRLQIEQEEGHPGESRPTVFVEGCGSDGNGTFSKGYAQFFSNDDADLFVAIDCQQANLFNSNTAMRAAPTGFGEDHLVEAKNFLEYQIFFDNFSDQLVIIDTLSPMLDLSTFQPGTGSQPYWYQINKEGIIQFQILPDRFLTSIGKGFVKFKIKPKIDTPNGSIIYNTASIYQGLKTPVITNKIYHTIGNDFLNTTVSTAEPYDQQSLLHLFPNPASDKILFQLNSPESNDYTITIFNASGQLIQEAAFNNQTYEFQKGVLPTGLYLYRLLHPKGVFETGTFILME